MLSSVELQVILHGPLSPNDDVLLDTDQAGACVAQPSCVLNLQKRSSFQILQKRMSHCAVRKGKIHTSILVLLCRSKICKIFPWGWQLFFFIFFLTGRNGLLIFASGCFKAKADNAPTSPTQTESQSPSSV